MVKSLPVYAKQSDKVRLQVPLGYAGTKKEAFAIVREKLPTLYHGANGHQIENVVIGVEELGDENGEYYVAKRQIREL
jgi:hypothetical protein